MNNVLKEKLAQHLGHKVSVVKYGDCLTLECEDCNEVIFDSDVYDLKDVERVEFVSYNGEYPNLCSGLLVVKIDGVEVKFGGSDHTGFWCSGGCIKGDNNCNMWAERGEWELGHIEDEFKDVAEELIRVFNENVEHGCCGGCI